MPSVLWAMVWLPPDLSVPSNLRCCFDPHSGQPHLRPATLFMAFSRFHFLVPVCNRERTRLHRSLSRYLVDGTPSRAPCEQAPPPLTAFCRLERSFPWLQISRRPRTEALALPAHRQPLTCDLDCFAHPPSAFWHPNSAQLRKTLHALFATSPSPLRPPFPSLHKRNGRFNARSSVLHWPWLRRCPRRQLFARSPVITHYLFRQCFLTRARLAFEGAVRTWFQPPDRSQRPSRLFLDPGFCPQ